MCKKWLVVFLVGFCSFFMVMRANADPRLTLAQLLQAGPSAFGEVLGDPNGDVTLIEFSDYNCGMCRRVSPEISRLQQQDKKLRIVMVEYPVISAYSPEIAKAVVAAAAQGKYELFHYALLAHQGPIEQDNLLAIAKEQGLDVAQLQKDMGSKKVMGQVQQGLDFGNALGLSGTPVFIIAKTTFKDKPVPQAIPVIIYGASSYSRFANTVRDVRDN